MDDYVGNVRITNTYFSGHRGTIIPTLTRSINAIIREGRRPDFFYIGIASGYDYYFALKRRIDEKKIEKGVNHMHLLYQSSSQKNTKLLEEALIWHFKGRDPDYKKIGRIAPLVGSISGHRTASGLEHLFWNDMPGGGGRPGAGPYYYLYLAVSRF